MLAAFDDCCLWAYVVVDEAYARLPAAYELGRGPLPGCSDSALIAMGLVGECRGWQRETDLVRCWRERPTCSRSSRSAAASTAVAATWRTPSTPSGRRSSPCSMWRRTAIVATLGTSGHARVPGPEALVGTR
jgi:hypothetical protein